MDYFTRTKIRSIILDEKIKIGEKPIILGWVRSVRQSKNVIFVAVNDGSCMGTLQGVISDPDSFPDLEKLSTGSSVRMVGELVESQGKGQKYEITVESLELLGGADESYPLQKKRHSYEFLREIAHLRPRTNTFGAVNRIRSKLAYAIHKFYQDRGFYYIHTPIITASDAEGAGDMFRVTTLDLENPPRVDGKIDFNKDFFSTATYLTVSGQLDGELLATALGDIYTFGPTFRSEKSNTSRHVSEFWMIEPEMAFCELDEDMQLAEEFLKYLF
ncbi:MAG: asparagine--tRNA ligase, partial [candidate division Zixibacteria bacterium]|nr:asparagine--tRNA ligase [candidate division Zixibacteria bacterium]